MLGEVIDAALLLLWPGGGAGADHTTAVCFWFADAVCFWFADGSKHLAPLPLRH